VIRRLRIGTRGSALALWQSRHVAACLRETAPALHTTLVEISSTGDRITDVPLSHVEGTGFFTLSIEQALLDVGYDPALAGSTAKTMTAVGGHRAVLLNGATLGSKPWADRIALLAHEFGHSLQYELGGGRRGTSDQWLREGFADWLSIRVLERLEIVTMAALRRERLRQLRSAGRSRTPPLADLVTFPQWVRAGERQGAQMYALSFLAVDQLLERHGVAAVVGYFKRFAESQDRVANFRGAFGEDIESFEASLTATLWRR